MGPVADAVIFRLSQRTNNGTPPSPRDTLETPARLLRPAIRPRAGTRMAKELAASDRKIVGEDIKDVEFAWPIGMPLCRSVGRGVWEVRSTLTQGRIARVLFCEREGKMVLLHAFIKKTQKAPAGDLELAIKRKKEVT
jgi:phage-related protein